jgi:WD40 repeat protein
MPLVTRRQFVAGTGAAVGALLVEVLIPRMACADEAPGHDHPNRATCTAVTEDGSVAFSVDDSGQLSAWDLTKDFNRINFAARHSSKASFVSIGGKRIATAGYDGQVIIHDLALDKAPTENPRVFTGHRADGRNREVWVAILTPDGKQALSAANDGQILLWNADDPTQKPRVFTRPDDVPPAPVAGLAFLPPGNNSPTGFLSTYSYGEIHLWDINKQDGPIGTFAHNNSLQVNAVAVTPDGKSFLSGGFDGTLRVWSLQGPKDKEDRKIKAHRDWVWRVAVYPDANVPLAATAGEDGFVRVWNYKTGGQIGGDIPAPGGSMGVAFGPNQLLVFARGGLDQAKLVDKVTVVFP